MSYGANAFLSTQRTDSMCFAQRGCYCAISVAATHNQRTMLRKLISHPLSKISRDVLSLEEMLAECDTCCSRNGMQMQPTLTKSQIKCLQEAMYHSAENNHLGKITDPKQNRNVRIRIHSKNTQRHFFVFLQISHLNCERLAFHGHFMFGFNHWLLHTNCNWIQSSSNCCKNFRMCAQMTTVHNLSMNVFRYCSTYSVIAR